LGVGSIEPNCSNLLPWLDPGLYWRYCANDCCTRKIDTNNKILFILMN
jgi:hypothetical protein